MKVLDTSVIAKWYKEESGSKEALAIRDGYASGDFDIVVPDLLLYELANCIRFFGGSDENDAIGTIQNFLDLGITIIVPSPSLLKTTCILSFEYNVTIYDATYLALAKTLGADFITADKKFYDRVKKERGVFVLK